MKSFPHTSIPLLAFAAGDAFGGRLPGSGRVKPENLNSNDEITITDQVAEQLKNWSQKLGI